MIHTLLCGVSCLRGQSPFVLYQHVRQSGLCCRPDPPVLPTGSVFRISMTLPVGSSTSATPVTPGEDGSLQSGLPSRPYRYSESGDLLCSGGNPAYGSLPHPIQGPVIAGCLESLLLQSRCAVHDSDYECWSGGISLPRSDCVIQILPLHNQLGGYLYDLMIEFVGDWCCAKTFHDGGLNFVFISR